MGVIIPAGAAQVLHRISLTGDTDEMLVTYGLTLEASASVTMANALHAVFISVWDDFLSNQYTMLGCIIREGNPPNDPLIFESTSAGGTPGASVASFPPQNTATLIRKVTTASGRRNRGRMYFPGIVPDNGVSPAGVIDPAFLSGRQTAATDFLTQINAVTNVGGMVILHSEEPSTPTTVTSLIVDEVVATQRRRLRK